MDRPAEAPGLQDDAPGGSPALACVVLAHDDPAQVRRLVAALDPFPVLLHCDARTPAAVHRAMTADLPERVHLLPRRATPWAGWGAVEAELDGYRAALALPGIDHVALLTGADYPLRSSASTAALLAVLGARSLTWTSPLPFPGWGRDGGFWRLRYRFRPWRRRVLALPLPRRLPRGLVLAGGSVSKVLAREHVAAVVAAVDADPRLARRWRSTWAPDETFVPTLLHTPALVPGFAEHHVRAGGWVIAWADDDDAKSPPWLTRADLPRLRADRDEDSLGFPRLFARKFSSAVDAGVLDDVDRELRAGPAAVAAGSARG